MVLLMNLFPYTNGHLLVAPHRHTAELTALTADEQIEMMRLSGLSVEVLTDLYQPDGFNIGMNLGRASGGSVTEHIHLHVVPRWYGDTNFMAVLSETRVLPEALQAGYDRLHEAVERHVRSSSAL